MWVDAIRERSRGDHDEEGEFGDRQLGYIVLSVWHAWKERKNTKLQQTKANDSTQMRLRAENDYFMGSG